MPAGRASNAWPTSTSRSHTSMARSHGIQISYPRSPVYPVRETSTGMPAMVPVRRKYFKPDRSTLPAAEISRADVGPAPTAPRPVLRFPPPRPAARPRSAGTTAGSDRQPSTARPALQPRHGPIVDDHAAFVAPRRVNDLADGHFRRVAGDDPVHQARGVGAGEAVFEQRGDVDQRRAVANGCALVLVMHLVRRNRVVAGPLAVVQALA